VGLPPKNGGVLGICPGISTLAIGDDKWNTGKSINTVCPQKVPPP